MWTKVLDVELPDCVTLELSTLPAYNMTYWPSQDQALHGDTMRHKSV